MQTPAVVARNFGVMVVCRPFVKKSKKKASLYGRMAL
jgi:hypothetical protein